MINNQVILICIIYYIIFIIFVFQHIHFYELFFSIYYSKLVNSHFLKHSYNTVTIMELVNIINKNMLKSHITKLMSFKTFPEVLQHARTAAKNPNDYYHISDSHQGYDAFSFNKSNLEKILTEKDINLVTFLEKKMLSGNASKYTNIPKIVKKYSVPNMEGLNKNFNGARPCSVDQVEIGTYFREDYNILLENTNLSKYKKPSVIIEDYSDVFVKIVKNPKDCSALAHGTIINDSAVEEVKWFYNFLQNNEEMCLYLNNLLAENVFFPL